jgi:hypothetical protein
MDSRVLEECKDAYIEMINKRRLALVHSNYVNVPSIDVKKAF